MLFVFFLKKIELITNIHLNNLIWKIKQLQYNLKIELYSFNIKFILIRLYLKKGYELIYATIIL
jgi:hypothetical protein